MTLTVCRLIDRYKQLGGKIKQTCANFLYADISAKISVTSEHAAPNAIKLLGSSDSRSINMLAV